MEGRLERAGLLSLPRNGALKKAGHGPNGQQYDRRTARDGRARDRAPRRHATPSRHTTRRRPNRCAAHPEPFSYRMDLNGGTPPPPNGRRKREPEGRSPARMRRQGRAQRMPRQGGLRVGVGGRCKQAVPRSPPNTSFPQTPAAARARRAKPGATRRQAEAKRRARREDYGWGWAGGEIETGAATVTLSC
jgi:hypothetical protein